jgi:hypothetical protein
MHERELHPADIPACLLDISTSPNITDNLVQAN